MFSKQAKSGCYIMKLERQVGPILQGFVSQGKEFVAYLQQKVIERVLKRHDIWSDLYHYNITWLLYEKLILERQDWEDLIMGNCNCPEKEMTVAHTIVTKTIKMVSGYILEVELKGTAGTE